VNDKEIKTVLAFDIGLKRTGVASGQTLTKSANTVDQLKVTKGRFDWPKLDNLIDEWQPQIIVIGDPQTDDADLNKVINRFKSHIQQQHKIPIIEINEALSSVAANAELSNPRLHDEKRRMTSERKTALRDQVAACLILESYFNSLS